MKSLLSSRCSIVVSIPACHRFDRPRETRGKSPSLLSEFRKSRFLTWKFSEISFQLSLVQFPASASFMTDQDKLKVLQLLFFFFNFRGKKQKHDAKASNTSAKAGSEQVPLGRSPDPPLPLPQGPGASRYRAINYKQCTTHGSGSQPVDCCAGSWGGYGSYDNGDLEIGAGQPTS